jgi:hypothetical protein
LRELLLDPEKRDRVRVVEQLGLLGELIQRMREELDTRAPPNGSPR